MGDKTGISWTNATWNPIRGCSRVSEGCRHCYAERQALRITRFDRGRGVPEGQGAYDRLVHEVGGEARWNGQVRLVPELLDQPLRWKRPRRIFVNSMSDLFHEGLSDREIAMVFAVMSAAPRHTFQVLTKRPARMQSWCSNPGRLSEVAQIVAVELAAGKESMRLSWPLPNVWIGISAEDQATLDARVPDLLRCPAAVRWLSLEPQLGPVDLEQWLPREVETGQTTSSLVEGLDWIVQGGESGPGARPFDLAWARSARDQCKAAGTAYYLKQLGAKPHGNAARSLDLKHRSGAAPAEWPVDLRFQEFPEPRR
jgi:protein gp37